MDQLINQYNQTDDQIQKYDILNQKYQTLMHFKNYTDSIDALIR